MLVPSFNDHSSNDKNAALTDEIVSSHSLEPIVLRVLEAAAARHTRALKILDFGCGRGATVAHLRRLGYEAYGVEVSENYVRSARAYFKDDSGHFPATSLLNNGNSQFPDGFFDIVLSNQVFEHVQDISSLMVEIDRISAPDAVGLHIFPSRFSLVEPHLFMPVVHWLPKGGMRRWAIGLMIRLGIGAKHFSELPQDTRQAIYTDYSHQQTYYRSLKRLSSLFSNYNFLVSPIGKEKLVARGGNIGKMAKSPVVGSLLGKVYTLYNQTYLLATRDRSRDFRKSIAS